MPKREPIEPEDAPVVTTAVPAPVSEAVVEARDAAVRVCLRKGPASFDELLAAMPDEGLPAEERQVALRRCLARLRIKERSVKTDGQRWELTA